MALVLNDIQVVYRRRGVETHAVRGVSLRVQRGETVAVVGESGSGKTTIAKVAAGLQKATSGSLSWEQPAETPAEPTEKAWMTPGGAWPRRAQRRRVQMVFQHPVQSLDPLWRVRRVVQEPLRRSGLSAADAEPLVTELIRQVGLDLTILDRYPRELSGGQAQRIAIARALVSHPEIVILDEPTASLDQTVRARILTLLSELQARTQVGYLMITHDISSVRRLATRIAVMCRGRIVESGPAAAILDSPRHPYTSALIAAVPIADPRVPWDGTVPGYRWNDGPSQEPCPVGGTPCDQHGEGLHEIGFDHLVACTTPQRTK